MNPWVIIALMVAVGSAIGGAYWQGRQDGRTAEFAEAARDEAVALIATEAAAKATGEALANLKVVNRTIMNEVQREITKEIYRDPACRATDDGLRLINEAAAGQRHPPSGGELPASGAASGPRPGGAGTKAGGVGDAVQ